MIVLSIVGAPAVDEVEMMIATGEGIVSDEETLLIMNTENAVVVAAEAMDVARKRRTRMNSRVFLRLLLLVGPLLCLYHHIL